MGSIVWGVASKGCAAGRTSGAVIGGVAALLRCCVRGKTKGCVRGEALGLRVD